MTEAEFIELARKKWAELQQVKDSKSLYELEERFDQVVGDIELSVARISAGRSTQRPSKKKSAHQVRPRRASQSEQICGGN